MARHRARGETAGMNAISALDWPELSQQLDAQGYAVTGKILTPEDCAALIASYGTPIFRSRIIMGHHGYGRGEYQYFADPIPKPVARLRTGLYPPLAELANRWARRLGTDQN